MRGLVGWQAGPTLTHVEGGRWHAVVARQMRRSTPAQEFCSRLETNHTPVYIAGTLSTVGGAVADEPLTRG